VRHPLRHSDELTSIYFTPNTNKSQHIRMEHRVPEDNLSAKLLDRVRSAVARLGEPPTLTLTFLIFTKSSVSAILNVFTATRHPLYLPHLMSENPPEARIVSSTVTFSVIIMDSGSRLWIPASLLNVMKKACFWADLRLPSAIAW
jgi:hypothetical protein